MVERATFCGASSTRMASRARALRVRGRTDSPSLVLASIAPTSRTCSRAGAPTETAGGARHRLAVRTLATLFIGACYRK
jgi:hypothetical protein